jgi:hypothetical protein
LDRKQAKPPTHRAGCFSSLHPAESGNQSNDHIAVALAVSAHSPEAVDHGGGKPNVSLAADGVAHGLSTRRRQLAHRSLIQMNNQTGGDVHISAMTTAG